MRWRVGFYDDESAWAPDVLIDGRVHLSYDQSQIHAVVWVQDTTAFPASEVMQAAEVEPSGTTGVSTVGGVASGVYYYRLETASRHATRRLVRIK